MLVIRWTLLLTLFVSSATLTNLQAQCSSWESYPDGVQQAKEKHVIYRDLFKSKKYKEAFPLWEKLFETVQLPLPAKSRHFRDGITMYKEFAKAEKDKAKKKELIDKMVALYDQKAECLGETSKDRGWEGFYIYYLRGSSKRAVEVLERSIEIGKKETHYIGLLPIAKLTVYLFQSNMRRPEDKRDPKFTEEYMRNLYDQLKEISEYNIENNKEYSDKYKDKWTKIQAEFDKIGDLIWGCDFHIGKSRPKFEGDKYNMEQNKELLDLLKVKCGKENELYQEILAVYQPWKDSVDYEAAKAQFESLCNLDKGKFRMMESQKFEKAGDTEKAKEYEEKAYDWYEKSLEDPITDDCETTKEEKGELAYRIAYRTFKKGAYSKARSLCRKAAELKSGWGEPYMLIGTMYASSGKRCSGGKGTGWDAQVVAWAAMDMWQKAKSVDPSVAGKANSMIAKYRKYLPTKGDIFQRGLKVGASYSVGCWIGKTTTIRAGGE